MAFALHGIARRSYMSRLIATAATVLLLMLSSACAARHGRPIVGGSTCAESDRTILGNVTNSAGTPLEGRRVSAIDMATEQHYDATTAKNGGYTIKVPPGRYGWKWSCAAETSSRSSPTDQRQRRRRRRDS
jgi:hypothetical protein